jgi:hypothetical protein
VEAVFAQQSLSDLVNGGIGRLAGSGVLLVNGSSTSGS